MEDGIGRREGKKEEVLEESGKHEGRRKEWKEGRRKEGKEGRVKREEGEGGKAQDKRIM